MHMADALLSPTIGATFWAASSAALAWCSKRLRSDSRDHLVPLMGVLGAFVFAAQMINFTIPGTGSSGHIGGGLLLSVLVGGPAAFLVIASVLTMQALFFADGGLLALGTNIFNLGVLPCFVAYPLIYRPLVKFSGPTPPKIRLAQITVLAAVIGLQLGALGVTIETQLSGISSLPLSTFLLLMQPVHFAIGLVEGLATAVILAFVREARPDLIAIAAPSNSDVRPSAGFPTKVIAILAALALATGGVFSWFASEKPDGLEWSIEKITGKSEIVSMDAVHHTLAQLQQTITLMPDYKFAQPETGAPSDSSAEKFWPAIDAGTSTAGVFGGLGTLLLVTLVGYLLGLRRTRATV